MPHGGFEPYPSFIGEMAAVPRVRQMLRTVRHHVGRARSVGMDEREVIDSLRPDTQALWYGLPLDEKRRFLRHLFRHWEIVRSRIPPVSQAIIERMRTTGQLHVIAGRLRDLVETDRAIDVYYTQRNSAAVEREEADRVVNCMGPESDYRVVDDVLVKNLLRRGTIRPGPADIGLDAEPGGAIVDADGRASDRLYALGSPMKGVLWEVIAVPDIRVQAQQLAHRLL
jgi:uncharacterized NAD(P)/FAD-binding protein YdhS